MITTILIKRKKKKGFWFEHNQDAEGYAYGDNRAIAPSKKETRRILNF